jgi:hypothetical protein
VQKYRYRFLVNGDQSDNVGLKDNDVHSDSGVQG